MFFVTAVTIFENSTYTLCFKKKKGKEERKIKNERHREEKVGN